MTIYSRKLREAGLKTRKDLPSFGRVAGVRFDIEEMRAHCEREGLFDFGRYNDIKASSQSKQAPFVRTNAYNKKSFFTEEAAPELEGELYKQLYLTEAPPEVLNRPIRAESAGSPGRRLARLDRGHPAYDPIADELNYTFRNHLVKGVFAQILDFFPDQVTRVRLAYLAPGFSIKPHVDYDPSYISRFHIPILTNPGCTMNVVRGTVETTHFPADGHIYFLNAGLKHWAGNESAFPRLHLIVDVHGQKTLQKLEPFPAGAER